MSIQERFIAGIGCFEVLEHLSDYVDGEAPHEVVTKIEGHLKVCNTCEKFGGEFSGVVSSLRKSLVAQAPPSQIEARLRARLGLKNDIPSDS